MRYMITAKTIDDIEREHEFDADSDADAIETLSRFAGPLEGFFDYTPVLTREDGSEVDHGIG